MLRNFEVGGETITNRLGTAWGEFRVRVGGINHPSRLFAEVVSNRFFLLYFSTRGTGCLKRRNDT